MTPHARKRLIRITVWSLTSLLVLALYPGPVDGNWKSLNRGRSPQCACDSYNYDRLANGFIFGVSSGHPPPHCFGTYHTRNWGAYDGKITFLPHDVPVHGFATLLFAVEFSGWNNDMELVVYIRNFTRIARETTRQFQGLPARCPQRDMTVTREGDEIIMVNERRSQNASKAEVEAFIAKSIEKKRRTLLLESELSATDLQPFVSMLEARGIQARVVPQVIFR